MRGQEDRAALSSDLTEQDVKALLHQRVEPSDGLIQDQQLGLVHECLNQAELLPVPRRQLSNRTIEIGIKPFRERVAHPRINPASELRKVVEHDPPGQLRIQNQIPG